MSKIHHLFYLTDKDKQTLHRRITPTDDQQKMQQERWNELKDYLVEDLEALTSYKISSWLQGSYKFGTQVRPVRTGKEFDIDLGIYFKWSGEPTDGNYTPQQLKSFVQDSLANYEEEYDGEGIKKIETPAKERCSRIIFENDFHIDIPAYHLNPNEDSRALATENHGWERSDPKALHVWFLEMFADEDNSQARRMIRYFKIWSALNLESPPSSIMLTVLVAQIYKSLSESDTDGDDKAIQSVTEGMLNRLASSWSVFNPVDNSEDLNRLSQSEMYALVEGLKAFLNISTRALEADTELDSSAIWSEAFQHFFPTPEEKTIVTESNALMKVRFIPEVSIRAVSEDNPNIPYSGINEILIPKKCKIYFEITNPDQLPPGYRTTWIVRNTEEEAEFVNDLGHMVKTENPLRAEEHSAYKGTHYMDLYVHSIYGEIIGFRRIPVTISGNFAPPRNPKRKTPYWRNIGRRR